MGPFETLMKSVDSSSPELNTRGLANTLGTPEAHEMTSEALPQLTPILPSPVRVPPPTVGPLHMLLCTECSSHLCLVISCSSSESHPSLTSQIRLGCLARPVSLTLNFPALITVVTK